MYENLSISRIFQAAPQAPDWSPSRPDNLWELWDGVRPKEGPLMGWLRINPETGRRMSRPPQYLAVLTEQERAFVENYVNTGLLNHSARQAGYQEGYGHKLAVKPRIAEAIKQLTTAYIKTSGPVGFRVLVGIAEDTEGDPALRFKAAKDLLDRAQGQAATEHNISITTTSDRELMQRIESLQAQLGIEMPEELEGEWTEEEPLALPLVSDKPTAI